MSNPTPPVWACKNWGGYGHDWLDCSDCLVAYEEWLEGEQDNEEKRSSD